METGEEQPFKPLSTVDPGTLSFAVRIMASEMGKFKLPVPRVTTYAQFEGPEHCRQSDNVREQAEAFGDYVFTYHEPGPGEKHTFYFARPRPPAVEFTPIASESYPTSAPHEWHDWLRKLFFFEDLSIPISFEQEDGTVGTAARVRPHVELVPGNVFATDFDVEVFMSHRPFQNSFRRLDVPVPTPVQAQVRNAEVNLGRCLHGRTVIPNLTPAETLIEACGTIDEEPPTPGMNNLIPATNHRRWKRHVAYRHQEKKDGLWILEVRWANPPRGVKAITKGANAYS